MLQDNPLVSIHGEKDYLFIVAHIARSCSRLKNIDLTGNTSIGNASDTSDAGNFQVVSFFTPLQSVSSCRIVTNCMPSVFAPAKM